MHEQRLRTRQSHQGRIHLVGAEDFLARFGFMLHAHARPNIGVNHVRTHHGFRRIVHQGHVAAFTLGIGHNGAVRLVPRRCGNSQMSTQPCRAVNQ